MGTTHGPSRPFGVTAMTRLVCLASASAILLATLLLAASQSAEPAAEKTLTNSLGMKLARIEPGEFTMGEGDGPPKSRAEWLLRDHDESPAHKVKITKAFYLGTHEVTNSQFEQFAPQHKKVR